MLTFTTFRYANVERAAKAFPMCEDWTPAQWLQALVGELGEYANIRKKFERGDISEQHFNVEAAKELADVQTYLVLLANSLDIDLGDAAEEKFNEISRRVNSDIFLVDGQVVQGPAAPDSVRSPYGGQLHGA